MIVFLFVLIMIGIIFLFFPRANAYFLLFLLIGGGCSSVAATIMHAGIRKPYYPSQVSVRAYSSRYKPYVPSDSYNSSSSVSYSSGSSSRSYSSGGLSGGK